MLDLLRYVRHRLGPSRTYSPSFLGSLESKCCLHTIEPNYRLIVSLLGCLNLRVSCSCPRTWTMTNLALIGFGCWILLHRCVVSRCIAHWYSSRQQQLLRSGHRLCRLGWCLCHRSHLWWYVIATRGTQMKCRNWLNCRLGGMNPAVVTGFALVEALAGNT